MKILAGLLGGLFLAVLGSILVGITLAAGTNASSLGVWAFFLFWGLGLVLAMTAPVAAKAWRRLLLTSAVLSFMLPLSGLVFTGSYLATQSTSGAAETAGAVIGGGLVSGALAFVGFFLGIVFLVVGLLVGRDKQIVYVQQAP